MEEKTISIFDKVRTKITISGKDENVLIVPTENTNTVRMIRFFVRPDNEIGDVLDDILLDKVIL